LLGKRPLARLIPMTMPQADGSAGCESPSAIALTGLRPGSFSSLTVSFLVNPGYSELNCPLRIVLFFFTSGIVLGLVRFRCVLEARLRFQGSKVPGVYLYSNFI
jgi:hypothetical protein